MNATSTESTANGSDLPRKLLAPVLPFLVLALACQWFAADPIAWTGFPLDDAWIHRVYSDSLAAGHGFAYNPGDLQAGFTSPLWVIITAPLHGIGLDVPDGITTGVKVIGLALALAIAVLAGTIRSGPGSGPGILVGCLVVLDPRMLFSAFSGMETLLVMLLWFLAVTARQRGHRLIMLASIGLLPVSRPEALLIVPLLLAMELPWILSSVRRMLISAGLVVSPMLAWVGFCLLTSGRPLPNTFYQKSGAWTFGPDQLEQIWALLALNGPLPGIVIVSGMALFVYHHWRRQPEQGARLTLSLVAAPVIYLVGVIASRDMQLHGYYWTRWADPAILVLGAIAIVGWVDTIAMAEIRVRAAWRRLALAFTGAVAVLAMLPGWADSMADRAAHLASDSRVIDTLNVEAGKWVAKETAADAVIGVNDAGGVRYFGGRTTIDLVGLNNHRILFDADYRRNIWNKIDWLIVYPWFPPPGFLDLFEPVLQVTIPPLNYTLCNCPDMRTVTIYRKRIP